MPEIPIMWRKSTRSLGGSNECVEVAIRDDFVFVRDSRDPTGPILIFEHQSWVKFIDAIRS